jgi:segregation and condensation protein A
MDFRGPLALILQLLSRSKIAVRDISLSLIIDQYLEWLDREAERSLDITSEFAAMASHLMFIKSKTLLGEERPEELEELISTLERIRATDVYLQIKSVLPILADAYFEGAGLITKLPEYFPDSARRYEHAADDLISAYEAIMFRTVSPDELLTNVKRGYPHPILFPIDEKIGQITALLRRNGSVLLRELFFECGERSERVAAFIAVLELCASGAVSLDDDGFTIYAADLGETFDGD